MRAGLRSREMVTIPRDELGGIRLLIVGSSRSVNYGSSASGLSLTWTGFPS